MRRYALELAREGLIHNVTSDAHDAGEAAAGARRASSRQAGLEPLTEWLTQLVPAAILGDEEIPPRPAAARVGGVRGVRRWRLRR